MYQGKFDAKARGQAAPDKTLDQILAEREAGAAAQSPKKAPRAAESPAAAPKTPAEQAPVRRPAPQDGEQSPARRPAPRNGKQTPAKRPAPRDGEQAPAKRPAAPGNRPQASGGAPAKRPAGQPARTGTPKQPTREAPPAQPPKKKGPRLGGVIFYSCYFLMIFVFFVGIFLTLNWLNGWLKEYEAAQPTVMCQQVFDQVFGTPDWAQIYRLAGDPNSTGTNKYDTDFEGVDQYVAYMTEKVGGQELNFVETSAGLSGNKKYIVRLGTERIATFTLVDKSERRTDIPSWVFGEVELFFTRNTSITLCKQENHLVYINGYPLNDDYTIQINSSKADASIAAAFQNRSAIQTVSGLLVAPQLQVRDQTGGTIQVLYNPDSGMYEEQVDSIAMTEAERTAIFGALEAYGGFMINVSGSRTDLAKYFDNNCEAYKAILQMGSELWMNHDKGHSFENREIISYSKYSATMFAVRASITMHAVGNDGTTIDRTLVQSMYFTLKNGNWVCTEMTNEDLSAPVAEVRITFCNADGSVISSEFYSNTVENLVVPMPETIPTGKVFAGWSQIQTGDDGKKTWNIMFKPDADGNVALGSGTVLQPMTLYPLFTNA